MMSLFLVPGSLFRVRVPSSGSRFGVPDSMFRVPGRAAPVMLLRCHARPRTLNSEPRTWNQNCEHELGTWNRERGTVDDVALLMMSLFLVPGSQFRVRVPSSGSRFGVPGSGFRVPGRAAPVMLLRCHARPRTLNSDPRTANVERELGTGTWNR